MLHVWVNGRFAGMAKDSRLASEFDITDLVRAGRNSLACMVVRWSDASYVEDQDQWWHAGIHREVFVYAPGTVRLRNVRVRAAADGSLLAGVEVGFTRRPRPGWKVAAELLDARGRRVVHLGPADVPLLEDPYAFSGHVAWLAATLDLSVVVLQGGYKAYRQWVLAVMAEPWPIKLLGGRTGAGKTELLLALAARGVAVVDLEGLAHHRGSSFGGLGQPAQPSTEHFENHLAAALHQQRTSPEIWLEAESAQVGRCRIPGELWRQMKAAPLLEVRRPLEARLRHLVAIYGDQDRGALVEATERIRKRLGPQRTTAAVEAIHLGQMEEACRQMLDYYDRCYDNDTAAHRATAADLGDLSAEEGAELLLKEGLIKPASLRREPARDR